MQKFFISHPSSARSSTPIFFRALEKFADDNADKAQILMPPERTVSFEERYISLQGSDLVIAEVSIASTGSGVELGLAHAEGKDVIAFHMSTSVMSPVVSVVATAIHSYLTEEDINNVLQTLL